MESDTRQANAQEKVIGANPASLNDPEPRPITEDLPLRRNEDLLLNMGPQHPATHGVLRVVLELEGEKIIKATPDLGFLHRGVEKLCEGLTYQQIIPHTDRLDYICSMSNNFAYVRAVEKLLGVTIPERGEYVRTIIAEMQRIVGHLFWLGTQALDIGAMTIFFWTFREREVLLDLFEEICGARLTMNYFRIGGVNGDLNHDFMSRLGAWMGRAAEQIEANLGLLNENEIFVRRMRGMGLLDRETAFSIGVTGPNLRASGVPFDFRRAHPYSVFPELDFDIPTRQEGDCLARYLLRIDEIKQSLRIIDQCLHQMPDGPVMAKLPRLMRPRPGRAYAAVEGPRGQYSTYAISDGTDQPFRMRIHDPSFIHLQSVGVMMPGHLIADTMAIMASLDPIMGGIDK